jgi:integrase
MEITGKRVFKFYQLYKDANEFNRAVGKGLKVIAEALGLESLTSYYARHSFATIARNDCGFSLEDVAEAMNHSVGKYKITDIYIKKTWDRVDRIQAAVLEKIKE